MHILNKSVYLTAQLLRAVGFDFAESRDERVIAMQRAIKDIGGKIEFSIEQHPDGSWTAESKNIDGIITGGSYTKEAPRVIKDAIFTYFGIPPHLCHDSLLKADTEPVRLTQRVYV